MKKQTFFKGVVPKKYLQSFFKLPCFQANAYPWIAALLRDEDIDGQYINSRCSAVLVSIQYPAFLQKMYIKLSFLSAHPNSNV